jgi:hypothetical protein
VEVMCSGVWGIGQGSFRLIVDEDKCLMETILRRDVMLRETIWRSKVDMTLGR